MIIYIIKDRLVQFHLDTQERSETDQEDQVLRCSTEVPAGLLLRGHVLLDDDEDTLYSAGTETLRREGCDRTVLTGPPQYDDEDQGGAVYMWGSY